MRRTWPKANPCLRYPSRYSDILLKQIRDEHNAAYTSNDPNKIRKFLTRRMCLWQVGSVNRYLDEHCMAKARAAMVPPAEFAALTDGLRLPLRVRPGQADRPVRRGGGV